jgi:hypothetical protein
MHSYQGPVDLGYDLAKAGGNVADTRTQLQVNVVFSFEGSKVVFAEQRHVLLDLCPSPIHE